jgi:hypothetical protein
MRKRLFLLLFTSIFFLTSNAQNDSCKLRISVLTCSPGEELYSTFGHTAVRIIDSTSGMDLVFNYGTFDFGDPDFYTKFVRGKLEYFLSYDGLQNFLYSYQIEKRSVMEQQLNMSCEEKQEFFLAVQNNLKAENKFYKYDFLYDNCTSRVRDLVKKYVKGFQIKKPLIEKGTSSRDLLYEYLDKGGKPWSKLGIDILLGSKLDEPINNDQAMFLPDYLMKGIDEAESQSGSLVKTKRHIFQTESISDKTGKNIPLIVLSIFSLLVIVFSLRQKKYSVTMKVIDSFIFYATGILGVLLLFMWFGTDHSVCQENYNLLWALPTHFIAAFFIVKRKDWVKKYFFIACIIHALTLAAWFFLPQHLNIALFPFVVLLMFRSYQLSRN